MITLQEIKKRVEAGIPGSDVTVEDTTGTGDHFQVTVISKAFVGLSLVDQHRRVYEALGADVGGAIHALALKTSTP